MIHFPYMNTIAASAIVEAIERRPIGTVFTPGDFSGSRSAVYTTLHRAVERGDITRLRNGIYYRGRKTPYGMTRPRPLDVGIAVAGEGAGPAGLTAAHFLGFTTQVPVVAEVAVPARAPTAPEGVRFVTRPARRISMKLTVHETALVEAMRLWPRGIEVDDAALVVMIKNLVADRRVSVGRVTRTLDTEHTPAARAKWHELLPALTS